MVVTLKKVFVYNFSKLDLFKEIKTSENPLGLCHADCNKLMFMNVLVTLDETPGSVTIHFFDEKKSDKVKIEAHNTPLAALEMTADANLLATASEKGTLVRVFSIKNGQRLFEFRRGSTKATIYSLSFNPSGSYIACTSSGGLVQVYSLEENQAKSQKSMYTFLHLVIFTPRLL